MENLIKNNPNIAQALPIAEEILKQGGSKREQLEKACKKANMDASQVEAQLSNLGISI